MSPNTHWTQNLSDIVVHSIMIDDEGSPKNAQENMKYSLFLFKLWLASDVREKPVKVKLIT